MTFLLAVGLTAASAGSARAEQDTEVAFVPDLALLRPMTRAEYDADSAKAPFVALFRRNGKQLAFVAARHEQSKDSATHRLVQSTIKSFAPEVVIVEGVETKLGTSPAGFLAHARRRMEGSACSESSYAAGLANEQGIPVVGGEPTDAEVLKAMEAKGYSYDDVLGFYLVRHTRQWQREKEASRPFSDFAEDYLERLMLGKFRDETDFDYSRFRTWYAERTGENFDPERIDRDAAAPYADSTCTPVQRMACEVSMVRDGNLARLQARMLNEYDRVLVVYGAGHFTKQRPILERLLGQSVSASASHQRPDATGAGAP